MSEKLIIGICGPSGAGKSTLRGMIPDHDHIYFAKALKAGLEAMGIPKACLYDPQWKNVPQPILAGRTGRYAMQTLGTEWGRDFMGHDFWVGLWHKQVQESAADVIVCDDLRFEQEVEAIRQYPNILVEVQRYGFEYGGHRSEQFDAAAHRIPTIMNEGTPEALYRKFLKLHPR